MDSTDLQSSTAQGSVKGGSALSSKVATILSTSYADSEFREALSLLDHKGLNNNARTRRQLRLGLQKEVIHSNGEIVTDFGRVADQLRRIQVTLNSLNHTYADMRQRITEAHKNTAPILDDAASMMRQRSEVAMKQELLTTLRNSFILTEKDVASLQSTAEPVDEKFFLSLAKAKKISKDCEILLGFEKQTLGLEVMEQISKNVNLAFQKLYKWVQKEFRILNLENPQLNPSIRRAIRVLAERPSLFQSCLDSFADARQRVLFDGFYVALTGSSPLGELDSSVKPIEMAAHDPLRYVGDMLAWIHSATVGEREALEVLFLSDGDEIAKGLQSGRANEIWRYVDDDDGAVASEFNALRALNELVDRDVSTATRILRQRIEQVIQSNEEIIPAYRLANLLSFYRFTFTRLLGEEAGLLEVLDGLETEALRQFRSLVRDHIAALQGEFQQTPHDLGPPEFLLDALKQLKSIMQTYETSLSASADQENDFQPILQEAFEPFLAGARRMATSIGFPGEPIFNVNCLLAAVSTLQPFGFTQRRVRELESLIKDEAAKLTLHQYRFFCDGSGLNGILDALGTVSPDSLDKVSLQKMEALQPGALNEASQRLDDFLPSALMDAMDQVKQVQDATLARELTEKAALEFCDKFEHIERIFVGADDLAMEQIDDPPLFRSSFPRTIGEIRVLLS